jgi:hypothetical protein
MWPKISRTMLYIQGIYYAITALWPLIDIDSFMYVTGKKTDLWLVHTVGLLILCNAILFLFTARYASLYVPVLLFALLSAAALAFIDFYYVFSGIISDVYLLDGVPEFCFVVFWCYYFFRRRRDNQ